MDPFQDTYGQIIAWAVSAFEQQFSKQGRPWEVVFMNEDTIVIALHGSLTAAESTLTQGPVGAAQVCAFHRQLFASVPLVQRISRISGMDVRHAAVEIEPATGRVVHVFTTDTVAEEFARALSRPARVQGPDIVSPRRCLRSPRRAVH